jgi:mono/diheme cytochrome c family protein
MKTFLIGLIVGLLVLPVLFGIAVVSGHFPVAASDPPLPFEKILAGAGLYGRIHKEAPNRNVSGMTTADLVSGASVYQKNCAFCHGLPQQSATPAAKGMFPPPPQLFTTDGGVTDDPAGVTYWKVKNGIRLTGMPGFQATLVDQDMWQVTALVARADKLPPEALDALKPAAPVLLISAGAAATVTTTPTLPAK